MAVDSDLLLETGDRLLLESGDRLLLDDTPTGADVLQDRYAPVWLVELEL